MIKSLFITIKLALFSVGYWFFLDWSADVVSAEAPLVISLIMFFLLVWFGVYHVSKSKSKSKRRRR